MAALNRSSIDPLIRADRLCNALRAILVGPLTDVLEIVLRGCWAKPWDER
jgi:hypothetical protein